MVTKTREFAAGWKVLIAATVGNALSAGTLAIHSMGIFGPPLGHDFHWGAGVVVGGILVLSSGTVVAAPLAGLLADRFGVRKVALWSTLLLAPAYMSFALLGPSAWTYYLIWLAVAFLGAGTQPVTWSRALNNRFQANKGLALGISLVATGVTGALLKPFGFWLVDHGGWRLGYIGLGCLPLISFFVALLLFFDAPATTSGAPAVLAPKAAPTGRSVGETLVNRRFWIITIAVFLAAAGVGGAVPNLESILKSSFLSGPAIRSVVPIMGLSIVAGRLGSSYLIDKVWAPIIAFVMLASAAASLFVLASIPQTPLMAATLIFLIGLAVGMEADVAAFLVARYFGARNYGTIYGLVYGAFAMGTGLGAVGFGMSFDRLHDYRLVLWVSAGVLLLSGGMLLTLGRYIFPYEGGRPVGRQRAQVEIPLPANRSQL